MQVQVQKIISEEGFFFFLFKVLLYINKNICGILITIIYELDLEKYVPKIVSDLELSFRAATKKDIDAMDEEQYGYDLKGKQFSKERLVKGDRCILVFHNDKIIGYVWVMNHRQMELSQFNLIPLSKNRVYLYKAFILKEFQGMRVANAIDDYISNMFKKPGKRFVVCKTEFDNNPAKKSRERGGFKRIGYTNVRNIYV